MRSVRFLIAALLIGAGLALPAHAAPASAKPEPRSGEAGRVLLLYVDGLRPDVAEAMAAEGLLPNFKAVFLDHGLTCSHAFSTFPSNTLVANGALWTGLLPDRTGIKSQNQFERTTLLPRGQASELLPDWWMERFSRRPRVYDLLDKYAPETTHQFLRRRGVPTLSSRLGSAFRFTILPIVPMNPPTQWLHQAVNAVDNPFTASWDIPEELDRINARYVIEELLGDPQARVIAAWFPMVDKHAHHHGRGQFGPTRRVIVAFDVLLGKMMRRLRQVHQAESTYVLLLSDHGHVGGEVEAPRHAQLIEALLHRQFGCNVRVVDKRWIVPGSDPSRFVFVDAQGWGQAAIFLPKGAYQSGPWRRNTLWELMHYDLGPNRGRVNLLEELARFRGPAWEAGWPAPVDLVLVKLDEARVLVMRDAEEAAIIHMRQEADGTERYRYEPVRQVTPRADGVVEYQPPLPGRDPLGYLAEAPVRASMAALAGSVEAFLAQPHTAQVWLQVSADSRYPDAVVGMAKYFSWRPPVDDLAEARDPDVLVTASAGWSFRTDRDTGTDHGHPLREAMRISLFLAGPNIRHGVLEAPHRIVDVLPTVLDMIGWPYESRELDGRALTNIYE